jgi:hypothetical protein
VTSDRIPRHVAWVGAADERHVQDRVVLELVDAALELGIGWLSVQEPLPGRALEQHREALGARGVLVHPGGSWDRAEVEKDATLHLLLAEPRSGRAELVDAVRRLAEQGLSPDEVDEQTIGDALAVPDVDLLVVSDGDHRVPDLLLWQGAYAEIVFLADAWREVGRAHFEAAITEYQQRDRRYGGLVASR